MRRKLVLILAVLAATAAPGAPEAAKARHRIRHVVHHAQPAKAETRPATSDAPGGLDTSGPMPAFGGLAALNEADARSRLGPPDIARSEGDGAMWTYRLTDCALFVFFRSAPGQVLKISGVSAGPRRRGQAPPPVETCIAEAGAGRP